MKPYKYAKPQKITTDERQRACAIGRLEREMPRIIEKFKRLGMIKIATPLSESEIATEIRRRSSRKGWRLNRQVAA